MSLYRAFFKIVRKNLMGILIYFGITLAIFLLLGGIYSSKAEEKAKLNRLSIYIENLDASPEAEALVAYLSSVHKVYEEKLTEEQITDNIYYEQILAFIRIPEGFGESFGKAGEKKIENHYDEAVPAGISLTLQIDNFLNGMRNYMALGLSAKEAAEKTEASLDITNYVSIRQQNVGPEKMMKGPFMYLPFGILSVLITGMFPVIVNFRTGEKRNRLQVSSMREGKRNAWILAGAATFALGALLIMVLAVTIFSGVDLAFSGEWCLGVVNALVFTLVISMMIFMLAHIPLFAGVTSVALTNIIGLSFCFIGGTFVPLSILGEKIAIVGRFLPNYWYSTAVERIFNGGGLTDILDCIGFQLSFGIACFFIGLAASRVTAERKQLA